MVFRRLTTHIRNTRSGIFHKYFVSQCHKYTKFKVYISWRRILKRFKMPCERCSAQFTIFKLKKSCCECGRYYCGDCLGRGVGLCGPCKILSTRPLRRSALDHLRVRDLQCFLHRQNISTRGCVEKEDLVNLVLSHVNSSDFPRQSHSQNSQNNFSAFSIKGFRNNINNFLSSTFDIGSSNSERLPSRRNQNNGTQNSSQDVGFQRPAPSAATHTQPPRSTSGLETASGVASSAIPSQNTSNSSSSRTQPVFSNLTPPQCIVTDTTTENTEADDNPLIDQRNTTDCVEIEDIDDDWEFLGQVADPLPQDSDELITDNIPIPLRTSARASSDFNLSSRISDDTSGETSSLKECTFIAPKTVPTRVNLDDLKDLSQVDKLNVKQLKELLVLNRVDFKGCCERNELLERAKRLWRENYKSREDLEKASTEELCKICMDAPMECVMLECGHIATCIACGKQLNECPICRQYVVRVVRFFRS